MKNIVFIYAFLTAAFAFAQTPGQQIPGQQTAVEKKVADMQEGPKASGALQSGVFFVEPKDGAKVAQEFTVKFGVHGMRVKPAGEIEIGTGHHHLIVRPASEKKKFSIAEKEVVAKDETHIHFGQGQEETTLNLKPGKYHLTLQFADGAHLSYGPKWSKTITVTVK